MSDLRLLPSPLNYLTFLQTSPHPLSVATMDQSVRQFKAATDCSSAAALEAASLHPARVLGLETHKGTLDYGADADMVVLDRELHVQATCIAGEVVWWDPNCCITGHLS